MFRISYIKGYLFNVNHEIIILLRRFYEILNVLKKNYCYII